MQPTPLLQAAHTTITHRSGDLARLGLGTTAAFLGALAVGRPARELAVDRARLGVALLRHRQLHTWHTRPINSDAFGRGQVLYPF